MTKNTSETTLTSTSTSTINTNKQETTMGTYIDMGPTIPKSDQNQEEEIEDEVSIKETTATADIGVNSKYFTFFFIVEYFISAFFLF